MAYYGPNAHFLGNIKLTMWHFVAVEDIDEVVWNLVVLTAIDTLSGVINGIVLWTTCKINIFKVLAGIQKELWLLMSVQEAFFFVQVKRKITKTTKTTKCLVRDLYYIS